MKAKIHFHAPDGSGHFETEVHGVTYKGWVMEVGEATAKSAGWGYFAGSDFSIPLRFITRIEKLED